MKRLIRKKWLRRSTQGLVIVVSLLGLANAAANRRAAVAKRSALDSLKSAGNLVEAAKAEVPMPPDEENFAMIPLLVKLREENDRRMPEEEQEVGNKFRRMAFDSSGRTLNRQRPADAFDLKATARDFQLTGSAAEMLEQFDGRHGEVLDALRSGLERPWTVRPPRADRFNPREMLESISTDVILLARAATWIAIRAQLALDAGKGDVALESLLMNRRLSDLARSEEMALGQFFAWHIDRQSIPPLVRGILLEAWDNSSLERLKNAWSGRDTRKDIERLLNVEGVSMAIFCEHWKRDRSLDSVFVGTTDNPFQRLRRNAVPDFWFDENIATILRTTEDTLKLVRKEGPLQSWWDQPGQEGGSGDPGPVGIRELDLPRPKGLVEKLCDLDSPSLGGFASSLLKRGSRAIVDESLVRLSCLLAQYKIAHGAYPATLDALGGSGIIDPLSGKPFIYRHREKGFVLYSIGPNGVDDGASRSPKSRFGAPDQLDWAW